MSGVKEIMGTSIMQKTSLISSTKMIQISHNNNINRKCPFVNNPMKGRKLMNNKSIVIKSAISEDYYLINKSSRKSDLGYDDESRNGKVKVRAVVTVRNKIKEDLKEAFVKHLDNFLDKIGRNVVLQLVSTDILARERRPKRSDEAILKDWTKKSNMKAERVNYSAEFIVESNYCIPGAILITNKHQQEFYLESITLEGFACGTLHFPCNSWVQSFNDLQTPRIFFHNKVPYPIS